tara:strand:- start:4056 stop:4244 length:189 start_codon:yes stop_codon:yes gene_type:complete
MYQLLDQARITVVLLYPIQLVYRELVAGLLCLPGYGRIKAWIESMLGGIIPRLAVVGVSAVP